MEFKVLGKTGLKVSAVGLGGIPVQRIDIDKTKELIDECIVQGINFIDTARGYSVSEAYLGEALEGKREHFILATKSMSRDYESMKRDIQISLDQLRTDYIDLYQIHNIKSDEEFNTCFSSEGAYKALLEAKAEGKIGHIGATVHSKDAFERLVNEYEDYIETIMFPFNIVENQGLELMKACYEKNIGFISMKPLAGGNITNASLAIKYIINNKYNSIVIPGMADVEEVRENVKAASLGELSEDDYKECEKIVEELGDHFCRRCGYCAPCPMGINIPSNFLFVNYLRHYGLADWAKDRYFAMEKRSKDCIECGLCESRCPYDLPIRSMLKDVARDMQDQ